MGKNSERNYSIGLDIGTNSVGWAVTDENYNLLRKKGRHMWGSRLFDQAETAQSRRLSRSIRRRYNKRRERIRLLRLIMNDMIMGDDPTFFIRMEHASFLDEEDKAKILGSNYKANYNLFIDPSFTDRDFYDKYPTIYHLRKELCHSKDKADPRLIYLALHHIVKYRGNFLYEGQTFSMDASNIEGKIEDALQMFSDANSLSIALSQEQIAGIADILKRQQIKKLKIDQLSQLFNISSENKAAYTQLFNALVGNQMSVTKMFINDTITSDDSEIKLKFTDANYDENFEQVENDLGDYAELIDLLHDIYGWEELQIILGATHASEISISNAMVERYEKHKADLKLLKKVIKSEAPEEYYKVFRDKDLKVHNYNNYINHPSKTSIEDFYKFLNSILDKCTSDDAKAIKKDIELENFLLKQNSRTNGSVPFQMQLDEMQKIIDNQSAYYPCLKENKDKLLAILSFRIPYYFGPLNQQSDFHWIIKNPGKEGERILPWNYEEVVDIDQTADKFISKMRNFCTYLPDQPVLPKYSLTYSKYEVLAELNKIRVNGKFIDSATKKEIMSSLFMQTKKVSDKALRTWLINHQYCNNKDDLEIRGYQKENEFSTSLTPWIDFTKIFGEITDKNYQMIEDIIYDVSVFEDKAMLKRRLKNVYKTLTDAQIKAICGLKYKGWARLSRKLIEGVIASNKYGAAVSILDVMEQSNMALMEIINDQDLGFDEIIKELTEDDAEGKFTYEEVDKLAGSPALKKGIWQSLLIVEEITQVMKNKPDNVYIEFSRDEDEKKRKDSVVKTLQKLYDDLKNDENIGEHPNYGKVSEELKHEDNSKKISSDRLQLYYTQMGKCMYSGKPLDIDKLSTYQIDHILPQSLIKDDSIDNRVLVISELNQRKLDDLVIPAEIRHKQFGFWKYLFDHKLISAKKYFSLIRTEFNEKDQERFINRQLVETRQIIKNVAQIINEHYTDTKVVTIRANLSHDFRMKYNIYKNRDINDYHHAHDAYIACILGTYIRRRYPNMEAKYIYGEYRKFFAKNEDKKQNDGFILNSMNSCSKSEDTDVVIWDPEWIGKIKKCFYFKDCFVTKKLEENDGNMFNLTVLANDKNSDKGITAATIPLNKDRADVHKYGGFSGLQYYSVAIKGKKKQKKGFKEINKITGLPLYLKNASLDEKIKYIKKSENLDEVTILDTKIFRNQLVEIDGGLYYLTSPSEFVTARQLVLDENSCRIVNDIYIAIAKNKFDDLKKEEMSIIYNLIIEKIAKLYPAFANIGKKLYQKYDVFMQLSLEQETNVIRQLLITLHSGAQNGNIKYEDFDLGSRIGRLNSKTIELNNTTLILTSVTGLYSSKKKL